MGACGDRRDGSHGFLMFDGELANIAGNPALARFGDEAIVLRLAGQLERARPWAADWPASCSVATAPAKR